MRTLAQDFLCYIVQILDLVSSRIIQILQQEIVSHFNCSIVLGEHFKNCHMSGPDFDTCIKDGLNDLRPFFKEGK